MPLLNLHDPNEVLNAAVGGKQLDGLGKQCTRTGQIVILDTLLYGQHGLPIRVCGILRAYSRHKDRKTEKQQKHTSHTALSRMSHSQCLHQTAVWHYLLSRVENWRAYVRLRWSFLCFRSGPQSGYHDHDSSSRHL